MTLSKHTVNKNHQIHCRLIWDHLNQVHFVHQIKTKNCLSDFGVEFHYRKLIYIKKSEPIKYGTRISAENNYSNLFLIFNLLKIIISTLESIQKKGSCKKLTILYIPSFRHQLDYKNFSYYVSLGPYLIALRTPYVA